MALTREELEHLTRRMRLTKEELAQLTPEQQQIAATLSAFEQGKLSELLRAQAAEAAKLDARIAKKTAFLHRFAVRNRVMEALKKAGAGTNAELLRPHVEEKVRVEERDDVIDFRVVDRDGKVRLRDGRPMTVEELMGEVRRLPELEDFFTKNGR